jgi:uncharacterized protein (TIGR01777 family)
MNILISGASGLVGRELSQVLAGQGHQIFPLRRDPCAMPFWDIQRRVVGLPPQQNMDAVIHLAGESVSAGCWTAERRERIRRSRVDGTGLLAEFFAAAAKKPKVIIAASAVGWYGDRGDEELDEASTPGKGFLAEVAQDWEAALQPAAAARIRCVSARFGIVLSPAGGALAKMLPLFRMGMGGIMGGGRQWMSWISLHEIPQVISHILAHDELSGPVNLTSPAPVTNREFTRVLAEALRRPAFLPAPRFLLEAAFGDMAKELLLASAKVMPGKLLKSGYVFREPELAAALRGLL